ncbi:serine/threonine protein kinase, partial [Nostoc linckia z16]
DWLIGVLLGYLLIGSLLAAFNAPYIIWAWAWAWAVAVAGAGAVTVTVAVAVAGTGAWAVAVAGAWAVVVAVTVALAVTVAMAVAWAGDELQKSFSKFHTFLILASTSSLGLGLGWLGHRIFNTGS